MNIVMWVIAGAALGWAGYAVLRANQDRGLMFSIIIGIAGGFFGGNVLAPIFGAVADPANNFNMYSLIIASASAAGCLTIADMLSSRLDV